MSETPSRNLVMLLASTNENIVRNLSVYLYKGFKLHSILTELLIQAHCHFKYLL